MPDTPWRLDGANAALTWRGFEAGLDLARPDLGLRIKHWRHVALGNLAPLGFVFPEVETGAVVFDSYQRGLDLIATYAETPSRPFRVQAYWRCVPDPPGDDADAIAIELQLSVQTPLLDCFPIVHTRTMFAAATSLERLQMTSSPPLTAETLSIESVTSGGEAFSAQVSDAPRLVQYIEMLHLADFQSNRIESDEHGWRLEHDLLEPGLEKGVIRRVRVRGVFCAGAINHEFIERIYHAFHAAALPLTA